MPSSVKDRPTDSHEMVYLMTKRARYFYDGDAVREGSNTYTRKAGGYSDHVGTSESHKNMAIGGLGSRDVTTTGRNLRTVWTIPEDERAEFEQFKAWKTARQGELKDVWTINPQAYSKAHFACVDDQTECLTQRGWLGHEEIKPGDQAAQFDMDTGLLSWGQVDTVARYPVSEQPMVTTEYRDVRMSLTPNHRCVVQTRRESGGSTRPRSCEPTNLERITGFRLQLAGRMRLESSPAVAMRLSLWGGGSPRGGPQTDGRFCRNRNQRTLATWTKSGGLSVRGGGRLGETEQRRGWGLRSSGVLIALGQTGLRSCHLVSVCAMTF
jgi:hypothetical protein